MTDTVRDKAAIAVRNALVPALEWAQNRLTMTRPEVPIWVNLKHDAVTNVLNALHDAGLAIVPVGGRLEPALTVERVTPYQYKARVQVEVPASYIAWADVVYDAIWTVHPRAGEEIARQLIKKIAYYFEERMIDLIGPDAARADFAPKAPEDA